MQGGNSSQPNPSENIGMAYIFIALVLFCGLLYWIFHRQIIEVLFFIKGFELRLISYFLPGYTSLLIWMDKVPPSQVTFAQVHALALDVGLPLRLPEIILCVLFAVFAWRYHPDVGYRDVENMHTLSEKMRDTFPSLRVIDGLDLVNTPLNEGPWAMAKTPVEFARQHKLIERDPVTNLWAVKTARAKMLFSSQLGKRWQGINALQPHERALFGVFAAFIHYQRETAEKVLEEINRRLTPAKVKTGNLDFSPAEAVFADFADTPQVKEVTDKHAYLLTVFSAMLEQARSTGIVASSQFLWLKPLDRRLWYVLNNVGRKAVFSEGSGVRSHKMAEDEIGKAISMPMVDEAVVALEAAIAERIIKDK